MTFHCALCKDQEPWLFSACSPLSPTLGSSISLVFSPSCEATNPHGPGAPGCSVLSLHLLFSTHLSDLNSSPLPWQELPMAPGPRQSGAHFTLLHSPSWHSSQFTIMCLCLWLMSVSPTELKGCTGRMRMCLIVTGSVAASPAPALCYLLNQYLRAEEGAMIRLHCHLFASDISKDDPPKCRAFLLNV